MENKKKKRKAFNTTIEIELLKDIKILAIKKDRELNSLIEEGLEYIKEKYSSDQES